MKTFKKIWNWFLSLFRQPIQQVVPTLSNRGIEIGNLVKITSGKRHVWYESNLGIIRKPLTTN